MRKFHPKQYLFVVVLILCLSPSLRLSAADGPDDNVPSKVRQVPPPGIELAASTREQLLASTTKLRERVDASDAPVDEQREVLIFARAVEMAIEFSMFYSEQEVDHAGSLLELANLRLENIAAGKRGINLLLADGKTSAKSHLVIGGFQSKLDGSIQPYGLVIPSDLLIEKTKPVRLDVWLHGRDEKTSEVEFLHRRITQPGEFTPANTVVLHPYGRYSNAFKFAGEVDVLEAIEHVRHLIPVDENRINIRGFSMGGAGCWQMAVHFPGTWCVATPGAGFSETTQFLDVFQKEKFEPTWFQKKLLHWYDCPDWSSNLRYLPTVAYSGELDRQKQAADVMEQSLQDRGIELRHIIGPQTEHKFHPESKIAIEDFMANSTEIGRPAFPTKIDFTTFTLRYATDAWLRVEGLGEHWQEARVQATIVDSKNMSLTTSNVTALSIRFPVDNPRYDGDPITIAIDGQSILCHWKTEGGIQQMQLGKTDGKWHESITESLFHVRKTPGLQGPIDDAFMQPFLFISPERFSDDVVGKWIKKEFQHATGEWRRHFRGDSPIRAANEVTEDEIADKNLILFGTPETNSFIAKIADKLPIAWDHSDIDVGNHRFTADSHAVVMVYPNPLNPKRYVVLNSGFTFREFAYLNNARQIPMLPDWAVLDITDGSTSQLPGKIEAAGFFDEEWQLQPDER